MTMLRTMPVLQVSDVRASVAFYGRLGFVCNGEWTGDDGTEDVHFGIVQRGAVTIGPQLLRGPLRVNTDWAAHIYVDDVAALHRKFTEQGLSPSQLRQQPYGCDDFDLRDPDGHQIAFGQDRNPEHGPGLGAELGRG